MNKASANSSDDCSGKEGSEARECEEEVIEVIGTYDDDSSYDIGGWLEESSYDGGSSGSDNGGGGDPDDNLTLEEKIAKVERDQECMRESIALEKNCLKNPTQTLNDLYFVCNLLSTGIGALNAWAGLGAASACYAAYRYDLDVLSDSCQANVEEAMETCY